MTALLLLLALMAPAGASSDASRSSLSATISGTTRALEVDLLLRGNGEAWQKVASKHLRPTVREARFEGLAAGVYQLLLRGPEASEQLATKVVLGSREERQLAIEVEPVELVGRVTLGGTELGGGALFLEHKELRWFGGIPLDSHGRFCVPFWQPGEFLGSVRSPALATTYVSSVRLAGQPSIDLAIDIPDGRITGVVRDAASGRPVANAIVALQTNDESAEHHVRLTTGADGRFDFAGVEYGRQIVRVLSMKHLEPSPLAFELHGGTRLRELDVRVDPGRTLSLLVADAASDPAGQANVYAVTGSRICARSMTDAEGQASIAVPAGEDVTLIVVPRNGTFGVLRVSGDDRAAGDQRELRIDLPPPSASLNIRAQTTAGATMPPFSLVMRYNGALFPPQLAEDLLTVLGVRLTTDDRSELRLAQIPPGKYEFWPYRTADEAEAIAMTADTAAAPIDVEVRAGANQFAVQFAAR